MEKEVCGRVHVPGAPCTLYHFPLFHLALLHLGLIWNKGGSCLGLWLRPGCRRRRLLRVCGHVAEKEKRDRAGSVGRAHLGSESMAGPRRRLVCPLSDARLGGSARRPVRGSMSVIQKRKADNPASSQSGREGTAAAMFATHRGKLVHDCL